MPSFDRGDRQFHDPIFENKALTIMAARLRQSHSLRCFSKLTSLEQEFVA